MRIHCPNCGAKLDLDEKQFANQSPSQVRCWMCTCAVELDMVPTGPGPPTIAVSSPHDRSKGSRLGGTLNPETTSLSLPQGTTIKISVLTGSSQGIECQLSRPLVTIGRLGGGADIEIDDPEVSKLHCVVEARRDVILLRDLGSTNGTYLGNSSVFAARLEEMSKFRIGSSLLQVTIHSAAEGRSHKDESLDKM